MLQGAAAGNLATLCFNALDPAGAVRLTRGAVKLGEPDLREAHPAGTVHRTVWTQHMLARSLAQLGGFEEGIAHAHATIQLAEDLGTPNTAAMAWTASDTSTPSAETSTRPARC